MGWEMIHQQGRLWEEAEGDWAGMPFTPRDYQVECHDSMFDAVREGYSGSLCRAFTGAGKSVIAAMLSNSWLSLGPDRRAMIIAHERKLVTQMAGNINKFLQHRADIEMGDMRLRPGDHSRVIVASRQSLVSKRRYEKFNPNLKWLLIFDEAHKYAMKLKTVGPIIEHFSGAFRFGLTATPERGDNVSLEKLFPHVSLEFPLATRGMRNGVDAGWAVPYKQKFIKINSIDFNNIKDIAGDFSDDELDEALSMRRNGLEMIRPLLDLAENRKTIVFTPTIDSAKLCAAMLNKETGRSVAKHLDGSVEDAKREAVYAEHQRGEFQFLCVCGLCREGYDDVGISCVAIFRPTKSRSLAEQMKGRGCRPLKGTVDGILDPEDRKAAIASSAKKDCLVIDLVGVSGLGPCASTAHLYASGESDELYREANEILESGTTDDVGEAITKARSLVEQNAALSRYYARKAAERARARMDRLARLKGVVDYSVLDPESDGVESIPRKRGEWRVPFGKEKGRVLDRASESSLKWVLSKLNGKSKFKRPIERELERRAACGT